jgi:glucose/arabinose dehydrogenase
MTVAWLFAEFATASSFAQQYPGLRIEEYASGISQPAAIDFAPDGRLFVAERQGIVRIVQNGQVLAPPFIDLSEEMNARGDRGFLGLALDPEFAANGQVYLLYALDPVPGEPDEAETVPTACRLVRYSADPSPSGNVADPLSRRVLIGEELSEGWITCSRSHSIGTVCFASDGTLLVGAGDGGHFELTDAGGIDPDCFAPPLFSADQDVGAFRSQYLDTLSGKIIRIDPSTGLGLSDNPFWDGEADSIRSRIWVLGLRNPFRFCVRPGSGAVGSIYIGDVGWNQFEEVNVSRIGGENFGWPCFEGMQAVAQYQNAMPAHSDCSQMPTAHQPPLLAWHHSNGSLSTPPGFAGRAAVGGLFYTARRDPAPLHGDYFFADLLGPIGPANGWIRAAKLSDGDEFVSMAQVAGANHVVDFAAHPETGDIYYATLSDGRIRRIVPLPGDCNADDVIDEDDEDCFEPCYSPAAASVAPDSACSVVDFDADGAIDCDDWRDFVAVAEHPEDLLLDVEDLVGTLLGNINQESFPFCRADVNGDDDLNAGDVTAYLDALLSD